VIIGTDTGFFLKYAAGNARAAQLWEELGRGDHRLVVSVLSVAEYLAYHIKRGTASAAEEIVKGLQAMPNVELVPVSLVSLQSEEVSQDLVGSS
jgi:predicted nucleic acid-binding protein